MKFLSFCKLVTDVDQVLSYLRQQGVLRLTIDCDRCGSTMPTQKYAQWLDGCCFRCNFCKTRKSIRCGSFLVDCRIPLEKFVALVYLLNLDVLVKNIVEILDISENTIISYANLIREERGRHLLTYGQMIGGQGQRVQIDESLIAKSKQTRNLHARPVREQWVFGAYDVEQKLGWIQLVENRSAETLLPLISQWCLPGSIIVSDGWAAYRGIQELGFSHEVVVHENIFVDPETGVHTNNVESFWQRCKRRLKRIYGTSRNLLPSHIDDFLWIDRYGKSIHARWDNTLLLLRDNYVLI